MNRRSGFTMVEIMVTMTIGSALMVLGVGLVHQTLTLSTASRVRSDHLRSLNRLARQFRADIHRASSCTIESPDQMLLEMPDSRTVTFTADSNIIVRLQPTGDGRTRRAHYRLSPDAAIKFETVDDPDRARLTVTRSTRFTTHESIDRRTEAVIGHLATLEQAEVPK